MLLIQGILIGVASTDFAMRVGMAVELAVIGREMGVDSSLSSSLPLALKP